ncbi:MAG: cysteine dioxygenase family protein [Phycisphaerales bacterium]
MTTFAAKSGGGSEGSGTDGCSPLSPQQKYPKLARLIDYLLSLKGRADLKTLDHLLREANITKADIESACVFGTKSYRRNTIANSEHFELLALTWRSGHTTPIHDHAGVSCAFRVVHGTGTEIRFQLTPSGVICPVGATQMQPGYICSAEEPDIHQVANMQAPGEDVVTLHIYSPRIKKMKTYKYCASEGAENCDAYQAPTCGT